MFKTAFLEEVTPKTKVDFVGLGERIILDNKSCSFIPTDEQALLQLVLVDVQESI